MPSSGPSGRVRHDERGVAVWDWAVATGEFATLSTTRAFKKLEVADLKIEDHKPAELKLEASGRDKAGGFDPYNQRGTGKRQGEAAQRAGVTGSPDRDRGSVLDQLTGKKKIACGAAGRCGVNSTGMPAGLPGIAPISRRSSSFSCRTSFHSRPAVFS